MNTDWTDGQARAGGESAMEEGREKEGSIGELVQEGLMIKP